MSQDKKLLSDVVSAEEHEVFMSAINQYRSESVLNEYPDWAFCVNESTGERWIAVDGRRISPVLKRETLAEALKRKHGSTS